MLIEFKFSNYRSFRDETVLSMEATGLGTFKNCLIQEKSTKLLPGVAIYGKTAEEKVMLSVPFGLLCSLLRTHRGHNTKKQRFP